jgi:3-dehydroquinate synthase
MRDIEGKLPPVAELVDIMHQDKKAQGGKLTFILARAIGDAFIAKNIPDADVIAFLNEDLSTK